ncbi:hypothetical protein NUH88_18165 [Nisaea acidiphila]|uniref:Fenitrothion hydrolase n=1 Tax=Nisaea acidiphila TaxID=1862145 RepID=A0A9J7ARX4_9PROT|nr:hypothetical protein [Nisaea acidiphila]UUX49313.1 hypothetical protein NUH88_18165 [Nisaea acidiphila]
MTVRKSVFAVKLAVLCLALLWPVQASAHVSEQGFVLLLPTGIYTASGVAVVALTVVLLFAVPTGPMRALFLARGFTVQPPEGLRTATSLAMFLVMLATIFIGLEGPRDPLSNLMSLMFWTVGWVGFIAMTGLFGNLFHWLNPWTGLYRLFCPMRPMVRLSPRIGVWPAVLLLVGFAAFLLADIAPDDPGRLAKLVGLYWLAMMIGLVLCGPDWLRQVELGSVLSRTYAGLAPARLGEKSGIGAPGWRLVGRDPVPAAGIFALTLLAVGSFDGINETFWWLGQIGVNPLEFPGRSAVVWPTLTGLVCAVVILPATFALTIWLGLVAARAKTGFVETFKRLAPSLLPIAFAYHVVHYLTSFLVNGQHTLAALNDPFARGADYLGLAPFHVTTGFFNRIDTVEIIWLSQAGAVVLGHVWSVLLAHRMALDLFPDNRRAVLVTLPLSIFMILYTFLGLWLLAAPKGA